MLPLCLVMRLALRKRKTLLRHPAKTYSSAACRNSDCALENSSTRKAASAPSKRRKAHRNGRSMTRRRRREVTQAAASHHNRRPALPSQWCCLPKRRPALHFRNLSSLKQFNLDLKQTRLMEPQAWASASASAQFPYPTHTGPRSRFLRPWRVASFCTCTTPVVFLSGGGTMDV